MPKTTKTTRHTTTATPQGVQLDITPDQPVPEGQPALTITFACVRCGKVETRQQSKPGFLPRYCATCRDITDTEKAAERQARWRAENRERARQTQKRRRTLQKEAEKTSDNR